MTLSRVARLMSVGCGGQVLVSFATQELIHDDLPPGIQLTDLGKWRLKNLRHPEHIFQMVIPGQPCDFPSLTRNATKDFSMDTIRLLIADDHALFREGLRALFSALPDIEVVGEAADGATSITQVDKSQPDVVLMDINMPGINGIEATRRILSNHPKLGIIMVTMLEDDASVFAAMRAGARGYVLKGAHHDEILQAIRAVAAGQAVFGPAIAARMMNFFQELNSAPQTGSSVTAFPELTEREREILNLMAQGVSNKAIAEKLVISMKTVSNHITNIFSKLQVADRAQAIIRARDAGLG
jgi:DNA-binding NarL/FixJ family response regulator